jgi:DNA-binding transcriptional ArsR family regulator
MVEQAFTAATPFTPADERVISDLETLRVLADPLRISILEYLARPGTVKQVAEKLDRPPTKLYYHFNLLEKHALIQMISTRVVSGIIEKQYQATARIFRVDRGLLSPGSATFDQGLEVTLNGLFGDARNDIRESIASGMVETAQDAPKARRLLINQGRLNLTPQKAEEFYERLSDLITEFQAFTEDAEGTRPYKLMVLLHPSSRRSLDDSEPGE